MWCMEKHLFSNVMAVEENDVKIPKKFLSLLQVGGQSKFAKETAYGQDDVLDENVD